MYDTYPYETVNTLDEFEDDIAGLDVEEALNDAMMNEDGRPQDEDDYAIIRAYKHELYSTAPTQEYENDKIRMDTYHDLVEGASSDLITNVTQRREGSLEFALNTFNKI